MNIPTAVLSIFLIPSRKEIFFLSFIDVHATELV